MPGNRTSLKADAILFATSKIGIMAHWFCMVVLPGQLVLKVYHLCREQKHCMTGNSVSAAMTAFAAGNATTTADPIFP